MEMMDTPCQDGKEQHRGGSIPCVADYMAEHKLLRHLSMVAYDKSSCIYAHILKVFHKPFHKKHRSHDMECCGGLRGLPYTSSWSSKYKEGTLPHYDKYDLLDGNMDESLSKACHIQEDVFHMGWEGTTLLHHNGMSALQTLTSGKVGSNQGDRAPNTCGIHNATFSHRSNHTCALHPHNIFDCTYVVHISSSCCNVVHICILLSFSLHKKSPSYLYHICT